MYTPWQSARAHCCRGLRPAGTPGGSLWLHKGAQHRPPVPAIHTDGAFATQRMWQTPSSGAGHGCACLWAACQGALLQRTTTCRSRQKPPLAGWMSSAPWLAACRTDCALCLPFLSAPCRSGVQACRACVLLPLLFCRACAAAAQGLPVLLCQYGNWYASSDAGLGMVQSVLSGRS